MWIENSERHLGTAPAREKAKLSPITHMGQSTGTLIKRSIYNSIIYISETSIYNPDWKAISYDSLHAVV